MSTTTDRARERDHRKDPRERQDQVTVQDTGRRVPDPAEETAPEAVRAARVAQRDRADKATAADAARRLRGVEWVRPTDLLARQSAAVAGRGIDFEVELARRARQFTGQMTRSGGRGAGEVGKAISERARRLPDVSEFGRGSRHQSWVSRSGIGLG
ncbi:hypothetical protein [Sediminivirga luteola]|jgi:hypothetical protein|uniref:Uncharacterized protein n=1 Tax=Sediminivirga luteola TaxID=1774748 RepID=A0A8J2TYU8_9MICO|nr:hypothetical protein [Sediminivirga luteola]EIC06913.1 hypothetical protein OR221_3047 [Microbacterium laevaniformans OR221]GGA16915.1 hypothetical protein GCM10011333_19980 [Sediminivirga luteola]